MKSKYITPSVLLFDENGKIDIKKMEEHLEFLIQGGMDGVLLFGSIGEFFSIPMEEKKALIEAAVKKVDHRIQLMIGTTSMVLAETLELSKFADKAGADAVIILPPYYFPISQAAIEEYYDRIATELPDQPLYIYNFPDRTGYNIDADTVLRIATKHKNYIGIKDTQAGMANTIALIKAIKPVRPEFEIFSGFDDNFAHNVLSGGDGCISGLSNIYPELCHKWVAAMEADDIKGVAEVQQTINGLMEIYAVGTPFVPYIKAAMIEHGRDIKPYSTFPFPQEVSEDSKAKIRAILKKWNNG